MSRKAPLRSRRPAQRRPPQQAQRNQPSLQGRQRICILCEGKVTEVHYFESIKRELSLSSVTIRHVPLKEMKRHIQAMIREDPGMDEIWCVVDDDERPSVPTFTGWLSVQSNRASNGAQVASAVSVPCFEYWLLLHFKNTTKSYRAVGAGNSACRQVIQELQKHLPNYDKAKPSTWRTCHELRADACRNARSATAASGTSSTEVWQLVERLVALGDRTLQQ